MKTIKMIFSLVFAITFLFCGNAMATEMSLQEIINNLTVDGNSSVNVDTDYLNHDSYWNLTASGGSVATMIIELAGYAGVNSFGVYNVNNVGDYVQLFSGAQGEGAQALLSIKDDGSVYVNFADSGVDFSGNLFGYYLSTPNGTFYSDSTLNDDGLDHLMAYQGNDNDVIDLPGVSPGTWTDNEFILAWEDLFNFQNPDYNDMVLMVESVQPAPVPEPTTILLLSSGLIGIAGAGRKKLFKK